MNRKQFILALAALVLVGGAGLLLLQRNRQSWTVRETEAGKQVLPNFRPNDVAAIHVKGSSDFEVVRSNGVWRVPERGGYPANYTLLREFLIKMRDLKVVQSEMIGPSELARLDLSGPGQGPGSGTLLEFKDAQGKVLDALLLGKKHDRPQKESEPLGLHGFFDGRYVVVPSAPHNVLLIADELANIAPEPGPWLSPDFFKVQNIKFISLLSPNPTNSWELSRGSDSSPWILAHLKPGEALDTTNAADAAEIMAFARFDDAFPRTALSSTGLDRPTVVTVLTDQLAYTLKVGPKRPDGNYLLTVAVAADIPAQRVADQGEQPEAKQALDREFQDQTKQLRDKLTREQALAAWVYVVDSWIELVIRDRAQLLLKQSPVADQSAQR
jgi:Domain of unknown function (DUF4340)